MNTTEQMAQQLAQTFSRIQQERMQGLPFLHPGLQVQAVDFQSWQGDLLGVLITPWFMNLVLLPSEQDWPHHQVGAKSQHWFPSGEYEFTDGEETGIGPYRMCSLFSPMQAFENQDAALETARAILPALMDGDNVEMLNQYQEWQIQPADTDVADASQKAPLPHNLSRRSLLFGQAGE